MRKNYITKESFEKHFSKGLTNLQLSKIFNCGLSTIKTYKKAFGFTKPLIKSIDLEEVKNLYYQDLLDREIAAKLKVNVNSIVKCRKKLNLPARYKIYKEFTLNSFEHQALIGSILGDSSLTLSKGRHAYLNFAHSINQKEYFFHKYSLWSKILRGWKKYETLHSKTKKVYIKLTTFSETHPELTKLYNLFYPESKKIITAQSVKLLDIISIAYLFMDDGSHATSGGGVLCTNGFDKTSVEVLSNHIFSLSGISSSIDSEGRLYFTKAEFQKLCFLIQPYIIPSMTYKLHLGPH